MAKRATLTELRELLASEGCTREPWSTPEAVLERVYRLLIERRDDEQFWVRLKELVARLEERRFDPRALPGFEVLGDAATDRLIDTLRVSLDASAAEPRPMKTWLGRSAGVAAVAFLLFGLSISCQEEGAAEPVDYGWEVENWDCEHEAAVYDITELEEIDRLCELGDFVKGSGVSAREQDMMLDCLPGLDEAYRISLLEDFQSATAEELNSILEDLTADWAVCGRQYDDHSDRGCDMSFH